MSSFISPTGRPSIKCGSSYITDDASFWTAPDAPDSPDGAGKGSRFSTASIDSSSTVRASDPARGDWRDEVEDGIAGVEKLYVEGVGGMVGDDEGEGDALAGALGVGGSTAYTSQQDEAKTLGRAAKDKSEVFQAGLGDGGGAQEREDLAVTIHDEHAEYQRVKYVSLPTATDTTSDHPPASFDAPISASHCTSTSPTPSRCQYSQVALAHTTQSSHISTATSTSIDETPFPSRILHLFPRLSTLTPSPSSPANARAPLNGLQSRLPVSMSINLAQLRDQLSEVCAGVRAAAGVGGEVRAGAAGDGASVGDGRLQEDADGEGPMGVVRCRDEEEQRQVGVSQVVRAVREAAVDVIRGLVGPSVKGMWMWPTQLREVLHDIKSTILPILPMIASSQINTSHIRALASSCTFPFTLFTTTSSFSPPFFHSMLSSVDEPAQTSALTVRAPRDHLYAQETLYTLRMPLPKVTQSEAAATGEGAEAQVSDIGPTVRPVWVKKRSAMPEFETRSEDRMAWGREVEWRMRL